MLNELEFTVTTNVSQLQILDGLRELAMTPAIQRVLVAAKDTILGKTLEDVLNVALWLPREQLLAVVSLCDELYEFTDDERTQVEAPLKTMGFTSYERLNPTMDFRSKYAMSIQGFVAEVNRGLGQPLFIRLLTSTEVDAKAFAYLLTVMAHPNSTAPDVYRSLSLCLEGVQLPDDERQLLRTILIKNGFTPSFVSTL